MSDSRKSIGHLVARGQWQTAMVALSLACACLSLASLFTLREMATHANELVARSLAFAGEPAVRFKDLEALKEIVVEVAQREALSEVEISLPDGHVWLLYSRPVAGRLDRIAGWIDRQFFPQSTKVPVLGEGQVLGQLSLRSNGYLLMRYLLRVAVGVLFCVGVTAIAVRAVSRRLSRAIVDPVNALAALTREVRTSRSFHRRAGGNAVHEFHELAQDFNSLLSELEVRQSNIAARQSDLQAANESLRHASRHDGLTHLPNRAYLTEYMVEVFKRCEQAQLRAAALFVDVDHFKAVNDQHGHEAGDALLVELARRLLASVRETDFVTRLGGDEFIVIVSPLSDVAEVERCAERIRQALVRSLLLADGTELRMSATIGAAIYPDHARDLDGLLRAADAAMYTAKSSERGSFASFGEAVV